MSFDELFNSKQLNVADSFGKDEKLPVFLIKIFTQNPELEIDYWQQIVLELTERQAVIENMIPPIATILPDFGIRTDQHIAWIDKVLQGLKKLEFVAGFYGFISSRTGYLGKKSPFYFGRFLNPSISFVENLFILERGEFVLFENLRQKSI